jgi:hypothetical protein
VGFAWDVYGNGKTALRGGYGIAYDQSPVSIYEQEVFNNVPFTNTVSYPAARLDNVNGNPAIANLNPPTLYGSPVNYQTPYVQQYSLDVQQAITPTMTLDVGYFGHHGTHLQGRVDINEAAPGSFAQQGIANDGSGFRPVNLGPLSTTAAPCSVAVGTSCTGNVTETTPTSPLLNVFNIPANCTGFVSSACENPLNQIRPYPGYGPINAVMTIFNSTYNALQVKVTKRFSGKSMVDANYTWSKSLTNAPNDYSSAPQNTYNLEPEYGRTPYDRTNVLTADGIWDLPWMRDQRGLIGHIAGGWEISGIFTMNSGLPLTATLSPGTPIDYGGYSSVYNPSLTNGGVGNDASGLGIVGTSMAQLRPTQVSDPNTGYGRTQLHYHNQWFNPTAFIAPSAAGFQVGNERRGAITGPGFSKFDIGVFRSFRLYKESYFQIRGEAFNVLNHVNWASVCTSTGDCGAYRFGQITAAHDPRILQVGGKLSF